MIKVPSSLLVARRMQVPTSLSLTARRLLHHTSILRGAAATAASTHPSWSGSSPEADFAALYVSANSATAEAEWSQQLSLALPPSDVVSQTTTKKEKKTALESQLHVSANSATAEAEWSQEMSFAAPEADNQQQQAVTLDQMLQQWQLSSPESAIGYTHVTETMNAATKKDFTSVLQNAGLPATPPVEEQETQLNLQEVDRMMQHLQISSPESALGFSHVGETLAETNKQELQSLFAGQAIPSALPETSPPLDQEAVDLMMQQLLCASPESATGHVHVAEVLTAGERHDLATALVASLPLPTTYEQAVADTHHRAIVITTATAPFKVVHVNEVWEGLCGFSRREALDKPIGRLLQGPATQRQVTTQLVSDLQRHPEMTHDLQLINYTKAGRKFHNHLQVGPLFSSSSSSSSMATTTVDHKKVEFLVGILEEVHDDEQGTQMAA